jgi:hypothetical protein
MAKRKIEIDDIEFNGKVYKTVSGNIKGFGWRTIAGRSLENEILRSDGYVSEDARMIDEAVFYFVDDSELDDPSGAIDHVEREVC